MAFQTFAPRSVCGVSETNSATTPPPPNPATGKCLLLPPLPPPPNQVGFRGSRTISATTPPPTEPGRLLALTETLPPPNKNPGYAGAPSMYRGSGNQMKIVPSYIVHALVTSLYTTYIFRGFVKKVLPQ